jgi:hypothetical protein
MLITNLDLETPIIDLSYRKLEDTLHFTLEE